MPRPLSRRPLLSPRPLSRRPLVLLLASLTVARAPVENYSCKCTTPVDEYHGTCVLDDGTTRPPTVPGPNGFGKLNDCCEWEFYTCEDSASAHCDDASYVYCEYGDVTPASTGACGGGAGAQRSPQSSQS